HIDILRGKVKPESSAPAAEAPASTPAPQSQAVPTSEAAPKTPEDVDDPAEDRVSSRELDEQHLALVDNLTQGSWFEMAPKAGERYRCRLAAIIRATGKYIFVNRGGMKVA